MSRTRRRWTCLAVFAVAFGLAGCPLARYPGWADRTWIDQFERGMAGKVRDADAIVVGRMVLSLGQSGVVSLYRVSEVLKGSQDIHRAMSPYPDLGETVMVAYDAPEVSHGHDEPRGETLIFLMRPAGPGKNMRLLQSRVDEGMIYALPWLVERVRDLAKVSASRPSW